jgi:TolC family type I secretion outer membrane protein
VKRLAAIALLLFAGCATVPPDHPTTGPEIPAAIKAADVPPPLAKPSPVLPRNAITTLDEAIDVALTNNPDTRAAWLEARAAEAAVGSERAAYLPEVDLDATLQRSRNAQQGANTSFNPSLSLNYLLFDFGGREARVAQARQTLIAATYVHNQTIQDVVLRVERAWFGYLGAKSLLAAEAATLKERQASLDVADGRRQAGVATIADVLQARTALSQTRLNYESIEGDLFTFAGQLATAMGLSPTTRIEAGELASDVAVDQIGGAVDDLIARAEQSRPDLAAARASIVRARERVREIRSDGLPSFSIGSSLGQTFLRGSTNTRITPYSAGVTMRFPLFTGFRNTFDIREAQLRAEVAEAGARSLSQDVALQVWTSYYAMQTSAQRVKTSRDLLASAQQSADVARGRYRAGVGIILDVLTAEAALESARALEVQARADWFLAMAQLAHDTGTLGPQPELERSTQ